ncbi:Aste57867_14257 [Aphanomyces stellatus]|uniref:Aste57867_14257 protein n=1 Tax=Aphanomyces stellatus TaxID=120398 RepID=A0A485L120_9STRA|nr:hypothetical protein As57867_014206 [Aphanomyces stellatus]VFT91082.1 Aste57867_14257 [Aphanomyces stellatus]
MPRLCSGTAGFVVNVKAIQVEFVDDVIALATMAVMLVSTDGRTEHLDTAPRHPIFLRHCTFVCSCAMIVQPVPFDAEVALRGVVDIPNFLPLVPFQRLPLAPATTWVDYYSARGIDATSPMAPLASYHLTVMYICHQLGLLAPSTSTNDAIVIKHVHLRGAEVEVRALLPLWNELSAFIPAHDHLKLTMVGPAVERCSRAFDRHDNNGGLLTLTFVPGLYHDSKLPPPDVAIALKFALRQSKRTSCLEHSIGLAAPRRHSSAPSTISPAHAKARSS